MDANQEVKNKTFYKADLLPEFYNADYWLVFQYHFSLLRLVKLNKQAK